MAHKLPIEMIILQKKNAFKLDEKLKSKKLEMSHFGPLLCKNGNTNSYITTIYLKKICS